MKITTLIPAYKSKYLFELLAALRHQTVKPHKIIFSDDSPDAAFTRQLNAPDLKALLSDLDISVVQGPRRGAHANCRHIVETWGGETELFHMLCDDDIVYPSFYERHLQAHASGEFSSTVSRRWTAFESGQPMRDLPVPAVIARHPQRMLALDADLMFSQTAAVGMNWLGEVSNTVMRAELGEKLCFPQMSGIPYAGLEDLGTFLFGTLSRPLCYINEHLGSFRTSAEQNSSLPMGRPLKLAHLGYMALSMAGREVGKLTQQQVQSCIAGIVPAVLAHYRQEADMAEMCALLPDLLAAKPLAEARFLDSWRAFAQ